MRRRVEVGGEPPAVGFPHLQGRRSTGARALSSMFVYSWLVEHFRQTFNQQAGQVKRRLASRVGCESVLGGARASGHVMHLCIQAGMLGCICKGGGLAEGACCHKSAGGARVVARMSTAASAGSRAAAARRGAEVARQHPGLSTLAPARLLRAREASVAAARRSVCARPSWPDAFDGGARRWLCSRNRSRLDCRRRSRSKRCSCRLGCRLRCWGGGGRRRWGWSRGGGWSCGCRSRRGWRSSSLSGRGRHRLRGRSLPAGRGSSAAVCCRQSSQSSDWR